MYRWFPSILKVVTIVQPETLVRWHRAGFRRYWRWKSNSRGGRPQIEIELRALILQMSTENQLWGAPRIHGELLKRHSPQERIGPLNPEPTPYRAAPAGRYFSTLVRRDRRTQPR